MGDSGVDRFMKHEWKMSMSGERGRRVMASTGSAEQGNLIGRDMGPSMGPSETLEWVNPNVDMHNMKEVVHDGQTRTTNYAPQPGPPNRETSLREAWGPTWAPV